MPDDFSSHVFGIQMHKWHDRFIRVKEDFQPHYGITLVTEKFYARHAALTDDTAKKPNVRKYMDKVIEREMSGPRELNNIPATENQAYGWLLDKAIRYLDESDRELFCRGRRVDPMTTIQLQISWDMKRDRRMR